MGESPYIIIHDFYINESTKIRGPIGITIELGSGLPNEVFIVMKPTSNSGLRDI